ncbi:MAG: response regulator [Bacteroidota bacterium]
MTENRWMLLVDDDPEDTEMLLDAIRSIAPTARIKSFLDGRSLLEFLATGTDRLKPCTIILDYNMPKMNGLDVLKELSGNHVFAHIPKLIWSTSDRAENVSACINCGAVDYLVKPSDPGELSRLAKKILGYCLGSA